MQLVLSVLASGHENRGCKPQEGWEMDSIRSIIIVFVEYSLHSCRSMAFVPTCLGFQYACIKQRGVLRRSITDRVKAFLGYYLSAFVTQLKTQVLTKAGIFTSKGYFVE